MPEETNSPQLNCPVCQKTVFWNASFPNRPFCSERCKLIDLGDWATEAHAIPGEPTFPTDTDSEDSEYY